jgi:two-component sensor histidine kinase
MRAIFPPIKSKPRFALDFSLIPAGIVLLEISVTLTEILKIRSGTTFNLLLLRAIHTIALLLLIWITERILHELKIYEAGYKGLWVLGIILAGLSEIIRDVLTLFVDVQLDTASHRFFIILIQGLFWIPVLIIVGGKLSQIFQVFKEYEKRLITNTRIHIRQSPRFKNIQESIEEQIRRDLLELSSLVYLYLRDAEAKDLTLQSRNNLVQPLLKGSALRALSLKLDNESNSKDEPSLFGQNMHSLSILSKQFKLMYNWMAKNHSLSPWVYTIIFTVLVAPTFINFFTIQRFILAFPPLFLAAFLFSNLINRILEKSGKYCIAQSNLLIILIGFLPYFENQIGQRILYVEATDFPFLLSGVLFPLGYYFYMRFLQITQPGAISGISNDELEASPALQKTVSKIVTQEFTQAISHRWAIYIHGKILTRLAATSLKLEQAVNNNDAETFNQTLENIQEILQNPTQDFDNDFGNLESEVLSRLDPWNGLINVSLDIHPDVAKISNPKVRDFGEAVEEIISNSVRHGGSQNISVKVTPMGDKDIFILVTDDAINPLPLVQSRIGLGTKILNLVSDGRWSISHNHSKTTFHMTMGMYEN